MRRFLIFVKKETLQILRDYRTMLIIIIMPIVQIILFGFALSMEVNNIDVAIYAPVRSNSTDDVATKLISNKYTTFKGYLDKSTDIDLLMKSGDIDIALIFSPDFNKADVQQGLNNPTLQLVTDAVNPVISRLSTNYILQIISDDVATSSPVNITSKMLYNPQMLSSYTFVPGILGLIIMIICTLVTSISIVREKETGTMDLLLVSPSKPLMVIGAKMIPYFILSCINLASVLILANTLLNVPIQGSIVSICFISFIYIILSLAFGVSISAISQNQVMAILISAVVLLIPVIMLSGLIFPIDNIPEILQYISVTVPARWYIDAMRKLMVEGLPLVACWKQVLILSGMTVFFIFVAVKQLNSKIKK